MKREVVASSPYVQLTSRFCNPKEPLCSSTPQLRQRERTSSHGVEAEQLRVPGLRGSILSKPAPFPGPAGERVLLRLAHRHAALQRNSAWGLRFYRNGPSHFPSFDTEEA